MQRHNYLSIYFCQNYCSFNFAKNPKKHKRSRMHTIWNEPQNYMKMRWRLMKISKSLITSLKKVSQKKKKIIKLIKSQISPFLSKETRKNSSFCDQLTNKNIFIFRLNNSVSCLFTFFRFKKGRLVNY